MPKPRSKEIWFAMKRRCRDPKANKYERYGGRGISVCERWLTYENFLADMGEPPIGHSLDRINNDGDYEPKNCRWATQTEQMRNSCLAKHITVNGITRTVRGWEEHLGLSVGALSHRLKNGWSREKATSTPKIRSVP